MERLSELVLIAMFFGYVWLVYQVCMWAGRGFVVVGL